MNSIAPSLQLQTLAMTVTCEAEIKVAADLSRKAASISGLNTSNGELEDFAKIELVTL